MKTTLQTFYFNTGVFPYNHTPPVPIGKGTVMKGGTLQIPFTCEAPENAFFKFASDNKEAGSGQRLFMAEILSGEMASKYAFFTLPIS